MVGDDRRHPLSRNEEDERPAVLVLLPAGVKATRPGHADRTGKLSVVCLAAGKSWRIACSNRSPSRIDSHSPSLLPLLSSSTHAPHTGRTPTLFARTHHSTRTRCPSLRPRRRRSKCREGRRWLGGEGERIVCWQVCMCGSVRADRVGAAGKPVCNPA